jgi:O-antigen ligase
MTTGLPSRADVGSADDSTVRQAGARAPWLLALYCILVVTVPSYVLPEGSFEPIGWPGRAIGVVLLLIAIVGFLRPRNSTVPPLVLPGVIIIVTYWILTTIVWGIGLSHLDSVPVEANKERVALTVLANIGVAVYAATQIKTIEQRSFILGTLAFALVAACIVGILQNATAIDLRLLFKPPGFFDNQAEFGNGVGAAIQERHGAKRAFGTFTHPIEFSVMAAAAVPLTLHFARYASNVKVRFLAAIATSVSLFSVPAGVSRSGVLALAAASLVYMWSFTLKQFCAAIAVFILALTAAIAIVPNTMQALWQTITGSSEDASVLVRIERYAKVSQSFHDHPIFGIGIGATPPAEYGPLDNQWLQALVQGGVLGLIAFSLLAAGGIFGIAAALRGQTTGSGRGQVYAMGAMYVAILSSSFTFDLLSFQQATLIFFLLFGLLWSNSTTRSPLLKAGKLDSSFAIAVPTLD